MAPAPRVPPQLTKGPFTVDEARRHGVSGSRLRGASWRRLGGGIYAWHGIAETPMTRLIAAQNRLLNAGYRLLRFTAGDVLDAPGAVVSMVRRVLASDAP